MLFADEFMTGLVFMGRILALVLGGASAVMIVGVVTLLLIVAVESAFDWVTSALARHWQRKGREPRSRVGKIIAGSKDGQTAV